MIVQVMPLMYTNAAADQLWNLVGLHIVHLFIVKRNQIRLHIASSF